MNFTNTELTKMFTDIRAVNTELGWYPNDRTVGEALALLHSEVSEALEAYRVHGFEDATYSDTTCHIPGTCPHTTHKPEGIGSELADILIRLIDSSEVFDVDLVTATSEFHGRFGMQDRFGDTCNVFHLLISRLSMAIDSYLSCPLPEERPGINKCYGQVYGFLTQVSERHGIDLRAEYARKLAYNRTRSYRHGNKRL